MVFSSTGFLFAFLPVLLLSYFLLRRFLGQKTGNLVLLAGSIIFMLWGSGADTLVLFAVILINYAAGILLGTGKSSRKIVLLSAMTLSIGILVFFKYSLFFSETLRSILVRLNLIWEIPEFVENIVLPLGISFYTFQALSYTIDVYYKKVGHTANIADFALYVSFFPQLIAGPIVRYKDIYRQIKQRVSDTSYIYEGMMRFMTGLAKKVLLANTVAKAADGIFALPVSELHPGLAWTGIVAYTLQIFLDFSAYSDMAIGLAKILGFDLKENFNLPYTARSLQDFWKRWHISLSSWLRDYLYIPLGGSRMGEKRTYLNLVIVFILCGLWHGASWTFVIWGAWHGMFLLAEKLFLGKLLRKIPVFIGRIYTMFAVALGWVLFRSDSVGHALSFFKSMFTLQAFSGVLYRIPREFAGADVLIAAILGVVVSAGAFSALKKFIDRSGTLAQNLYNAAVFLMFLLSISALYSGAYNPFIYFRF